MPQRRRDAASNTKEATLLAHYSGTLGGGSDRGKAVCGFGLHIIKWAIRESLYRLGK